MALTELAIKHLKPKDKVYRVADGEGLTLEVSPAGGKLWRYRYRHLGKGQMISLGKYPAVTLAEARRKRDEMKAQASEGKNLTREKKIQKLRQAREGENTFEKIALRFLEVKQGRLNQKYATQCLVRMKQHVFPRIGDLPITEITIPDVVAVVEAMGKTGTIETAKRMKQLIGQVFRYAAQRGICLHNPAADLRDILPAAEEKHHACIHPSELPVLLEKIETLQENVTKRSIKLLMLTFVRTGELIGAKWEEIDWGKEEWHIPKERMKMRRPHIVPLSKQALAILRELQKLTGEKEHIFHSPASKSMHISNGTVLMGLRRMGYKNKMTGHGFRSLASTILNEKGYSPDVIERQLAHEDEDKIRAAYNRAEYLPERKKMMQEYADFLDAVAKQANVIAGKFGKRLSA
ncbi:MAG TPA: integrase arm-type DNA-binding domain-containing protein [Rickettsiales bacterium]|nr:integrase arm-type DNA-binding domain-containing protein [Rickettsiales bacterium]